MISLFELFKVGIGPPSSHTTGPMKAARIFRSALLEHPEVVQVARFCVRLFGSLAWTGKGHGTDKAIVLGLSGYRPETLDPDEGEAVFNRTKTSRRLAVTPAFTIGFDCENDIIFNLEHSLPKHPNAMQLPNLRGDMVFNGRRLCRPRRAAGGEGSNGHSALV